ncbi:MAG: hypothetical protein KDD39_06515 [Bdellovibrionales bacterium]|nr:hypothetical protein [Bdellovibrionales bacterium]
MKLRPYLQSSIYVFFLFTLTACPFAMFGNKSSGSGSGSTGSNGDEGFEELAALPNNGVGRNVGGANMDSEAVCVLDGEKKQSSKDFTVQCYTVNKENGNELRNVETSVRLSWTDPPASEESNIRSISCTSSPDRTTHTCDISVYEEKTTSVDFHLTKEDVRNGVVVDTDTRTATVTLIEVEAYGFVFAIPQVFLAGSKGQISDTEYAGYQTLKFNPRAVQIDPAESGCFDGNAYYVTSQGFVYKVNLDGAAELFAGSANPSDTLTPGNTAHRLKTNLHPTLYTTCHPKNPGVIWVLSKIQYNPWDWTMSTMDPMYTTSGERWKIYMIKGDDLKFVAETSSIEAATMVYDQVPANTVKWGNYSTGFDLYNIMGYAAGKDGSLYLVEGRNVVRRIDPTGTTVYRFAGKGPCPGAFDPTNYQTDYKNWAKDHWLVDMDARAAVIRQSSEYNDACSTMDPSDPDYYATCDPETMYNAGTSVDSLPENCTMMGSPDGGMASTVARDALLYQAKDLAVSLDGSKIYITMGNSIYHIDQNGTLVADKYITGGLVPRHISVGSGNNMYFSSQKGLHRLDLATKVVTAIAGNGVNPYAYGGTYTFPEGGVPSTTESLPIVISVTAIPSTEAGTSDRLFFIYNDRDGRPDRHVRSIGADGLYRTVFGKVPGVEPKKRLASITQLEKASDVAIGPDGSIYYVDASHHRVWVIHRDEEGDMVVDPFLGTGQPGCSRDLGAPLEVKLEYPRSLAVDKDGSVYVADTDNHRVLKVTQAGVVTDLLNRGCDARPDDSEVNAPISDTGYYASTCTPWYETDSEGNSVEIPCSDEYVPEPDPPAEQCSAYTTFPVGVAVDAAKNVYVVTSGHIMTSDPSNSGGVDVSTNYVVKIDQVARKATYLTRGHCWYAAAGATFQSATDIAVSSDGTLYVPEALSHKVWRKKPAGNWEVFAGTGQMGDSGDGGPASQAKLKLPFAVAVDGQDRVYVSGGSPLGRVRNVDGYSSTSYMTAMGSEDGYYVTAGATYVRLFSPNESGVHIASNFLGGKTDRTCATGSFELEGEKEEAERYLKKTVANFCVAQIGAIGAWPYCDLNGAARTGAVFGQSFANWNHDENMENFDMTNPGMPTEFQEQNYAPASNILSISRDCF